MLTLALVLGLSSRASQHFGALGVDFESDQKPARGSWIGFNCESIGKERKCEIGAISTSFDVR